MSMSGQKGFEGWYFKHQKGDDMVAFIPGKAESGAFIQLISQEGARQFEISNLTVRDSVIRADGCWFSRQGCYISLPGISGDITYGPFAPLGSDIMGPFRFFPMECRHGVLSMAHTLQGRVLLELDIAPSHVGHPLRAPQCGKMSNTIRESCNAHLRARLWKRGKPIFDLQSDHAAYEFIPSHGA